jgi:hypothetical protein
MLLPQAGDRRCLYISRDAPGFVVLPSNVVIRALGSMSGFASVVDRSPDDRFRARLDDTVMTLLGIALNPNYVCRCRYGFSHFDRLFLLLLSLFSRGQQ